MSANGTFALGLTGWPLSHSLSPRLHAAALSDCGLHGEYRLYPLPPLPEGAVELRSLLARLRSGELHGLNVTIPHKRSVLTGVDMISAAAQAVGAVNTLYMKEGRLWGDNTDKAGFLADLHRLGLAHTGGSALVLGAGGAARACVAALDGAGWLVTVAARRIEQARELLSDLDLDESQALALTPERLQAAGQGVRLLVNASSLGMIPQVQSSPWPDDLPLPEGAFVYDLVYKPRQTRLMVAAVQAGLQAANGLGMLVEQAALSFELWTGCAPRREALWQTLDEAE